MSQLREQLEAAFKGEVTEPTVETAAPVEAAAAPAEVTTPEPVEPAQASGQPRGADGKFAPKSEDTPVEAGAQAATPPAPEPETAQPVEPEPQTEAIRVPPSLPAAVKAKFESLDPDVRSAFVKLEETVQTAKAEWGKKGERLNRYDEMIAPRLTHWRANGLDEFSGIQTLFAAQDLLERNPVSGLQFLARSYGVNLHALAQQAISQQPGAEGFQAPTGAIPGLENVLAPLAQQVQTLQQQLNAQNQAVETARQAEAHAEVDAFRNDPKNRYFADVQQDVAARLGSGAANTLAEAYEQATWASPTIRPLLLAAQAQPAAAPAPAPGVDAAAQAAEKARLKAQAANKAAVSVTGGPTPGAVPPKGPVGSVRDSLQAALQEHSA